MVYKSMSTLHLMLGNKNAKMREIFQGKNKDDRENTWNMDIQVIHEFHVHKIFCFYMHI